MTIVSGSPGTGKTTIARELAKEAPTGVHIESDEFYFFIANLIAPSSPEANRQNETVITAVARAAGAYASGGYDVFFDGVLGPWLLPVFVAAAGELPIDYIVLRTTLEDSLERVSNRDAPGIDEVVRKMHGQFADLGLLEHHVVDTHGLTVEHVLAEIDERRATSSFRLDGFPEEHDAPLFRKIDCLSLHVPDLDEALMFYSQQLGHELLWRSETAAGMKLPDSGAELVVHIEDRPTETDLTVTSTPDAVERFIASGGKLIAGPFDIAIGLCAVVADPWDNILVLLDTSKGALRMDGNRRVI